MELYEDMECQYSFESDEEIVEECQHETVMDGSCFHCGMKRENEFMNNLYSSNHANISKQISTFDHTVMSLDIPEIIKLKAIQIHETMKRNVNKEAKKYYKMHGFESKEGKFMHRSKKMTQVIFSCTFFAYYELGYKEDPKTIARKVGLPVKSMATAIATCSEDNTGYRLKENHTNPLDILPLYYDRLCLSPSKYYIVKKLAARLVRDSYIQNQTPPNVCVAILVYYCDINGIMIDDEEPIQSIPNILEYSQNITKDIVERIKILDNE